MNQEVMAPEERKAMEARLAARFEQSIAVPSAFFAAETEKIAEACRALAHRFYQGGRLLAFGNGAWATDAQHIAVEFVHPVIVGKRALPALALPNDGATLSALMAEGKGTMPFARQLHILARSHDIALGFSPDGNCTNIIAALEVARQMGLLTLALTGEDGGTLRQTTLDFCFVVPASDALVIQETHEALYHVLWEQVHVFFEHEGMLR
jgi:D-sedoheptulose 7-phosphate isomerase